MDTQKPPLIVLLLGAVAGVARAAMDKTRQKKKPRMTRQLTHEEMDPLDAHGRTQAETTAGDECSKRTWREYLVRTSRSSLITAAIRFVVLATAMIQAVIHQQWTIACLLVALTALLIWDLLMMQEVSFVKKPAAATPSPFASAAAVSREPSGQESAETEQKSESKAVVYDVDPRLTGTWYKVNDLSDSQDPAIKILKLSGLSRAAMVMFRGMEVSVDKDFLHMRALTKVPFLKVATEEYDLKGSIRNYQRRDMRKGHFYGYAKTQVEGGLNFYYKWDEPLSGHCCDEMRLIGNDELHITTYLAVGEESCAYRVVYWRAGSKGSGELLRPTESSGSLAKSSSQDAIGFDSNQPAAAAQAGPSAKASSQAAVAPAAKTSLKSSEASTEEPASSDTGSDPAVARGSYDSGSESAEGGKASRDKRKESQRPFARVLDM